MTPPTIPDLIAAVLDEHPPIKRRLLRAAIAVCAHIEARAATAGWTRLFLELELGRLERAGEVAR